MSKAKLMLGNAVEISLIFRRILGPLVLGWAPNHFVLGAQLAPGEKRLVCIPVTITTCKTFFSCISWSMTDQAETKVEALQTCFMCKLFLSSVNYHLSVNSIDS